jgi:hypothetical protein
MPSATYSMMVACAPVPLIAGLLLLECCRPRCPPGGVVCYVRLVAQAGGCNGWRCEITLALSDA